ncbi:hypothetical protein B0J13DRAFT_445795, partial [Dactylonectria estremocensis]
VVVCTRSYTFSEDSTTTIGQFPVFLVRTGVEKGLSAPITFRGVAGVEDDFTYYVKMTLETAVDFIMAMEAREAAVFGVQPDPKAAWDSWRRDMNSMGEYEEDLGDEPVIGPSSRFVDCSKYYSWGGNGRTQGRIAMQSEERSLRWQKKEVCDMGMQLRELEGKQL